MPAPAASRTGQPRPRIGVSSCLLGAQVRFNGGHSRCRFLTDDLDAHADWLPCCPEMAIGLGSPRDDLLTHIEAYRRGQAPLSVPVALLAHHASTGTLPWLAAQTYLQPFPAAGFPEAL